MRDQFVFLRRAGFDALEVKKESDAAAYRSVMERYTVFYQPTGDGRVTALEQRLLGLHPGGAPAAALRAGR